MTAAPRFGAGGEAARQCGQEPIDSCLPDQATHHNLYKNSTEQEKISQIHTNRLIQTCIGT
jgi:hypothetical protein